MNTKIIILILVLFSSLAQAYIPPYWMIMSRVADNHGIGPHRVTQDVTFYHGLEPLTVSETWTVVNEKEMRVDIIGKGILKDRVRMSFIYDENRRFYLDSNGRRQSVAAPKENPELYFHFRASKFIKPILVSFKMAPPESLRSESTRFNPKVTGIPEESFVRLARTGGVVAYALGSPASDERLNPGIWIEQDQFVIRKLRFQPDYEVVASDYKRFGKGLMLPQHRDLSWKGRTIRIVVSGANSVSTGPKLKEFLSPKGLLTPPEKDSPLAAWPDDNIIREFYTELR